jgi:hypothetical protein
MAFNMLKEYVFDIARQMGISSEEVSLVKSSTVGCVDTHLLKISFKNHTVSALVYRSELDNLLKGIKGDRLNLKVKAALERLKVLTAS